MFRKLSTDAATVDPLFSCEFSFDLLMTVNILLPEDSSWEFMMSYCSWSTSAWINVNSSQQTHHNREKLEKQRSVLEIIQSVELHIPERETVKKITLSLQFVVGILHQTVWIYHPHIIQQLFVNKCVFTNGGSEWRKMREFEFQSISTEWCFSQTDEFILQRWIDKQPL